MRSNSWRLIIDVLGVVAILGGLWGTFKMSLQPIVIYDEGIVLTNANLMLSGAMPYRDFYSNYPPGIFVLLASLWKVFGVSVIVERALGIAMHLGIAILAGRLAGRVLGRRFSPLACGLVLLWIVRLGTVAFAWVAGLMMALVFCELALRAMEKPSFARNLGAGLALGAVACLRHDLFVFLALACLPVALLWAYRRRRFAPWPSLNDTLVLSLGMIVPVALIWGPTFAAAGVELPFHHVFLDQVQHVQPARLMPLPENLWKFKTFEVSVVLTMLGPCLAVAMLLLGRASAAVAIVAVMSLAVLPQMLGRTEMYHSLYTVTPALILAAVCVERLAARGPSVFRGPLWAIVCLCYLVLPATKHLARDLRSPRWRTGDERSGDLPERDPIWARARQEVLAFVRANTAPGEPIFVGLKDHRIVLGNEMELYFLADRPGATRYMQFDPNMTNRLDQQREMIEDFERCHLRVVVLTEPIYDNIEPNESSIPGATLLDEYFAREFQTVEEVGHYRVLLRKETQ